MQREFELRTGLGGLRARTLFRALAAAANGADPNASVTISFLDSACDDLRVEAHLVFPGSDKRPDWSDRETVAQLEMRVIVQGAGERRFISTLRYSRGDFFAGAQYLAPASLMMSLDSRIDVLSYVRQCVRRARGFSCPEDLFELHVYLDVPVHQRRVLAAVARAAGVKAKGFRRIQGSPGPILKRGGRHTAPDFEFMIGGYLRSDPSELTASVCDLVAEFLGRGHDVLRLRLEKPATHRSRAAVMTREWTGSDPTIEAHFKLDRATIDIVSDLLVDAPYCWEIAEPVDFTHGATSSSDYVYLTFRTREESKLKQCREAISFESLLLSADVDLSRGAQWEVVCYDGKPDTCGT